MDAQPSKVQPYSAADFEPEWRRKIGKGTFSTVWNLRKKRDGDILTVKLYKSEAKDMVNARARELKVLSMIDFKQCPFIVELKGIYMNEGVVVGLIFESAELGNWSDFLIKYAALLRQRRFHMFELKVFHAHCISRALRYLRSLGIVHGDLAVANILIFRAGLRAKLCDFGSAGLDGSEEGPIPLSLPGRRAYLAPELKVEGTRSSFASDVYGFGVLLIDAFFGDADLLWSRCECQLRVGVSGRLQRIFLTDPDDVEQWDDFLNEIRESLVQAFPFDEMSGECTAVVELIMSCIAYRPDDRSEISNADDHLNNLIFQMEPRLKERKNTLKSIMNQELVSRMDSLPLTVTSPLPQLGLPSPRSVRRLPMTLPSLEPTANYVSVLLPSPGASGKPFFVTYDVARFESGDNAINSPSTPFQPFRNMASRNEEQIDVSGLRNPDGKPTQSMIRAVMHMKDLQRNLRSVLLFLKLDMVDLDTVDNKRESLGLVDEAAIVYFALDQLWLERHYRQATRAQLVEALARFNCRDAVNTLLNLPDDLD